MDEEETTHHLTWQERYNRAFEALMHVGDENFYELWYEFEHPRKCCDLMAPVALVMIGNQFWRVCPHHLFHPDFGIANATSRPLRGLEIG